MPQPLPKGRLKVATIFKDTNDRGKSSFIEDIQPNMMDLLDRFHDVMPDTLPKEFPPKRELLSHERASSVPHFFAQEELLG